MMARSHILLLAAALALLCLWPAAASAQEMPLATPGGMEREEYERALKDAVRAAGQRRNELEAVIADAQAAVRRFTPETELDARKKVAQTVVDAYEELGALLEKLDAYENALSTYLGTPILKLVELQPGGAPGAGSGSEDRGMLYSVDINEAPLEIIPGNSAQFAIDLIQRRKWDSEGSCTPAQNRPGRDDTTSRLVGVFAVHDNWADWHSLDSDSLVSAWGKRVFGRYCDQAPTYTKPDTGVVVQVPFEMQEQVRFTVTLRPTKFPYEGAYRFEGEARSDSRYAIRGFDGSQPLFTSTYADTDGYCTSPDGKCPDLFIVVGKASATAVLHYRHIRKGERFIAALPDYRHPNDFDKPLFVGEPPTLLALPDFTGRPLAEAKGWLQDNGLTVTLLPGEPAPTPDRTGTVQSQNPAPGMELEDGASVALYVHSPYVDAQTIPDVMGMALSKAKILLESAGFDWKLLPGPAAPNADLAGRIQKQDPAAGLQVQENIYVSLTVYGPYADAVRLPDLSGLTYAEAERRLRGLGLETVKGTTRKPTRREQAGRVAGQSPEAGASVAKDVAVSLSVYGAYTPSREEQIAQTDCRRFPGAVAVWDQSSGRAKCDCPSGLRWDINNAACVTQADFATQWCDKNYPTMVAVKLSDGDYQCQCRSGYVVNESTNRCVRKQPTRQERVASYNCSQYPGSRAYWNEQAGEPRCGCPSGLRWNMNETACVTQADYARDYCARTYPDTRAVKMNDGSWSCDCPSGMYLNKSTGRCIREQAQSNQNQGQSRKQKCDHLLFQAREFMKMYQRDPQGLGHMKGVAEMNLRQARSMGCDMGGTGQTTGGGGSSSGFDSGEGNPCTCVDAQGKPYSTLFGQDCGIGPKDYSCTPQ